MENVSLDQAIKEERKKWRWRPVIGMRLKICNSEDKRADYYIRMNAKHGTEIHYDEDMFGKGYYFTYVLRYSNTWSAN